MTNLTARLQERIVEGERVIGMNYNVRVRGDHAVVFVSAPDPRSDGRPQAAVAALTIELTAEEMLGLPGPRLCALVALRVAHAAIDFENSLRPEAPQPPAGATGAAVQGPLPDL